MIAYLITFVLFLLLFTFNPRTDYFRPKWWLFIQFIIVFLGIYICIDLSIFLALFLVYIASSSNYYSMYPYTGHIVNIPKRDTKFIGDVSKTNTAILASMIFIVLFPISIIEKYLVVAPFLLIAGSSYALLPKRFLMHKHKTKDYKIRSYGFGANPSVNSSLLSLIAATSAVKMFDSDIQLYATILGIILTFACIIRMKATSGLVAMIGGIGVMLTLIYPLALIPYIALIIGAYFILNKVYTNGLLSVSGRDLLLKYAFKKLYGENNYLVGNGIGSFQYMMPINQLIDNKKKNFGNILDNTFIWLHCDLAQYFLEAGYIGLIFLALLIGDIGFHLADAQPAIIAYFAVYASNSLTNFVNHMSPDGVLTMMMLKYLYANTN